MKKLLTDGLKMNLKGVVCAALLGVSISASAEQWVHVTDTTTASIWIDADSVVHSGTLVKAWVRTTFKRPTAMSGYNAPIITHLARWTYNCADRSGALSNTVAYDASQRSYEAWGNPNQFDDIPPGTVGEAVLERVCSKSN